jgi:hypothetical protein
MNTRSLTLCQQTRLAVNIVIEDDSGLLAFSIVLATRLFALFWQAGRWVSSVGDELSALANDARAALDFTGKVFAIGVSALGYGLGVTL